MPLLAPVTSAAEFSMAPKVPAKPAWWQAVAAFQPVRTPTSPNAQSHGITQSPAPGARIAADMHALGTLGAREFARAELADLAYSATLGPMLMPPGWRACEPASRTRR